jgi:hypothetical protein
MATLAIELNDAEIRVAVGGGVVVVEPGYALLDGESLVTGTEAVRAVRLKPRQIFDRFWADLNQAPLPRPHPRANSLADLAFAQLSSLWSRFGDGIDEVVFVVPGSYRRDQLGLLLGLAEACGIPARGLVDAAVASSRQRYPGRTLAHLDAGLHGAVLTLLAQNGGVSRETVESTVSVGLSALRERWLGAIADAFVAQTRFDPLHDARAEQALFDQLPASLEALRHRETARLEIEIRGASLAADLRRTHFTAVVDDLYHSLAELLRRVHPTDAPLLLQVSHRLAHLPGLLDRLASIPDLETVLLPADAACKGALSRLEEIRTRDGRLEFVRRLQWTSDSRAGSHGA